MSQLPRHVEHLPKDIQPVFKSFRFFNPIQSESFDIVFGSDSNLLISAPTGSGKTVVMELAICRMIHCHKQKHKGPQHEQRSAATLQPRPKTIFIAPTKSLVQEKARDWSKRFGTASLGLVTAEVSGDTDVESSAVCSESDIICTTAEKLDSLTRNQLHKGGATFFGEVGLLLIDEVHLLAENRGGTLEAVVSRIMMLSTADQMHYLPISAIRIVAVSATIPNAGDIAQWLHVPRQGLKVYGEEMRPVKLNTVVKAYHRPKTDFLLERRLNDYLPAILHEHSEGRPSLVFCSSRKGTIETASHLVSLATARGDASCYIRSSEQLRQLESATHSTSNKVLQAAIRVGVGFHHAGMDQSDRAMVEQLFRSRSLQVLCTTSTLALGVNLPAFLVVIKGTRLYVGVETAGTGGSGYREYDRSSCLQMIGRAGRPQFDSQGVAVIMTTTDHAHRYRNLVSGCERIDSTLHTAMIEHLNAEICLRTITDMKSATAWLHHTFLYICALKQPAKHGVTPPKQGANDWVHFDTSVTEKYVISRAKKLAQHGLVESDEPFYQLQSTRLGELMSLYGIRFETMVLILDVQPHASMEDLIACVSRCQELSQIRLRRGEKALLNALNKSGEIKYSVLDPNKPGKKLDRIKTSDQKLFLLIVAALSDADSLNQLDYSMRQEAEEALRVGRRVSACMEGVYTYLKAFAAAANASLLSRSLQLRLWQDTAHECRQMPAVGLKSSQRLCSAGLGRLIDLCAADPRRVERISMRAYPFGNQLQQEIRSRLPPTVKIAVSGSRVRNRSHSVQVHVTLTRSDDCSSTSKCRGLLLVGTGHNDQLLMAESLRLDSFQSPLTLRCTASSANNPSTRVVVYLMARDVIGADQTETLPLHLASSAPTPTAHAEISCGRNLRPYRVSSTGNKASPASTIKCASGEEPEPTPLLASRSLSSKQTANHDPTRGNPPEGSVGSKRVRSPQLGISAPLTHRSPSFRPSATFLPSTSCSAAAPGECVTSHYGSLDRPHRCSQQPASTAQPVKLQAYVSASRPPATPSMVQTKANSAASVASGGIRRWHDSGSSGSIHTSLLRTPATGPLQQTVYQGCNSLLDMQRKSTAAKPTAHIGAGFIAASSSKVAFSDSNAPAPKAAFSPCSPVRQLQVEPLRLGQQARSDITARAAPATCTLQAASLSRPTAAPGVAPNWMNFALNQTEHAEGAFSNGCHEHISSSVKSAWASTPRTRVQVHNMPRHMALPLRNGAATTETTQQFFPYRQDHTGTPSGTLSKAPAMKCFPFSQFRCLAGVSGSSTAGEVGEESHGAAGFDASQLPTAPRQSMQSKTLATEGNAASRPSSYTVTPHSHSGSPHQTSLASCYRPMEDSRQPSEPRLNPSCIPLSHSNPGSFSAISSHQIRTQHSWQLPAQPDACKGAMDHKQRM